MMAPAYTTTWSTAMKGAPSRPNTADSEHSVTMRAKAL